MKSSELKMMIRAIVREEVQRVLPALVKEHLADAYVKRLVRENTFVADDIDEDEVPKVKKNYDLGAYDDDASTNLNATDEREKKARNENLAQLLGKDNPMSFVFEGVSAVERQDPRAAVDLRAAEQKLNLDFSKMNEMVKRMEKGSAARAPVPVTENMKMRELEMKRKALEVRADGSRPAPAPIQRPPSVASRFDVSSMEDLYNVKMDEE